MLQKVYLDLLKCFLLFSRGPVNEDVFVAPTSAVAKTKTMDSDIQEITEQIHRLLLQVRGDKEIKEWITEEGLCFCDDNYEIIDANASIYR